MVDDTIITIVLLALVRQLVRLAEVLHEIRHTCCIKVYGVFGQQCPHQFSKT